MQLNIDSLRMKNSSRMNNQCSKTMQLKAHLLNNMLLFNVTNQCWHLTKHRLLLSQFLRFKLPNILHRVQLMLAPRLTCLRVLTNKCPREVATYNRHLFHKLMISQGWYQATLAMLQSKLQTCRPFTDNSRCHKMQTALRGWLLVTLKTCIKQTWKYQLNMKFRNYRRNMCLKQFQHRYSLRLTSKQSMCLRHPHQWNVAREDQEAVWTNGPSSSSS